MRRLTHDANVFFRAPKRVVAAAEAEADRRGMSFSELMRQALRREVFENAA